MSKRLKSSTIVAPIWCLFSTISYSNYLIKYISIGRNFLVQNGYHVVVPISDPYRSNVFWTVQIYSLSSFTRPLSSFSLSKNPNRPTHVWTAKIADKIPRVWYLPNTQKIILNLDANLLACMTCQICQNHNCCQI